jgi:hypothetical protein
MTDEERQHDEASTDGMRLAPDTSETVEQEIQRKALTAPRVTPADIEANIVAERYFTGLDGDVGHAVRANRPTPTHEHSLTLSLMTFCVLVLRNGFTVVGTSACASPENFNADLGCKIARQDAVRQVWPLMGYELRSIIAAKALLAAHAEAMVQRVDER